MARLPGTFNQEEVQGEMGDFPALPTDKYHLMIVDSDYKETKNKNGHLLKFEFKVMAGEHENKKLFTNLNLDNPSKTAVELAQKELATILRAVGLVSIDDSEELHGKELIADVRFVEGDKKKDIPDKNVIKNYFPLDGVASSSKKLIADDDEKKPEQKTKRRPVFQDDDD